MAGLERVRNRMCKVKEAKTVERDESEASDNEYRPSSIRINSAPLLAEQDERYAAKKTSSKKAFSGKSIVESSDELSSEDESLSDEEAEEEGSDPEPQSASDEEDLDSEDQESEDQESEDRESEDQESEVDDENPLRRGRNSKTGIQLISDMNLRSEIEKGNCVRNQLKIWENLLETRIRLQQCLQTSNKMPQREVHESFRSDPQFQKSTAESTSKLSTLLENLLEMQSILLNKNPETKNILVKEKKLKAEKEKIDDPMNEEIPSDTEDELEESADQEFVDNSEYFSSPKKKMKLEDFERLLAHNHQAYSQYRDSMIQKWNDKTRISAGNVNKGSQTQSVVKQIEFILNDKEKLRKRTQVKRSEYDIVGKEVSDELDGDGRHIQAYDSEIFDDDDFYHQLLRELIEHKSAGITDPIQLSKQWIQLQNMRNKLKRKIDTRATKGRRIRYVVHKKLVNFMPPITIYDTWSENAKNELYNSLFGKTSTEEKKVEE